jgi:glycosyltransferase involved in cell wall biosynthesis
MAMAEAMALGVPAVSSDIPGVSEVATPRTALLFPPGNALALADAIGTLMTDDTGTLREAMVQRARAHVVANFDVEHVAQEWDSFYREVAGDMKSPEATR